MLRWTDTADSHVRLSILAAGLMQDGVSILGDTRRTRHAARKHTASESLRGTVGTRAPATGVH